MEHADPICKTLIANFNIIALDSFGEEEKAGGHHVPMDPRGVEQKVILVRHINRRRA